MLLNLRVGRRVVAAAATNGLAALAMSLLTCCVGCGRESLVVPHERAPDLVALFGAAWSQPTGPFRITGGRMDGGVVRVFLAAPGRTASLTFEPVGARESASAESVLVEHPGNDVIIVLRCVPTCDAASIALLRPLAERVLAGQPGRFWVPAHGFAIGREQPLAFVLVLALSLAAAGLAVVVLRRARPVSGVQLTDAAAVLVVTLGVTALLGMPSMANWYSNNLLALGGIADAEDQNGMAGFFLQALVRLLAPWTDHTLFALNLTVHATAGALFYLAFRALRVERGVALLALLLWAVLPMSVRIGWSDAQHVQVELLFAAVLLVWLRAQDEGAWPERMLGPILAALLPLVRLEALALAPLPLLFGPLVGDRRCGRRLRDALVYGVWLAMAAAAVFELFVRRYDIPIPDLATRMRAPLSVPDVLQLFRQFVVVNSGMPNWFPRPATIFLAIGAAVLARRQPAWLLAMLAAFCLPQLLLDRCFNAEGMVGARYFLPLLALLALVAAQGLAAVVAGIRRLLAGYVGTSTATLAAYTMGALGALAVVLISLPLYHYEYAFQGEHRFLRQALANLPGDARVLHLPARSDARIHNDPDCCLDPSASPLALRFPLVHFEPIPIRAADPHLPAAVDDRTYYYEGALCRLAATPSSEGRNPGLSQTLREQCAALARDPRLELVASAQVPSNGFWPFLEPGDVPLHLYRIRPSNASAAAFTARRP